MRYRIPAGSLLALALALAPGSADAALTEGSFLIRNAQDLVTICSSDEADPLNDAADHFCHGFLVGAWQYHEAQANGPKGVRIACPQEPVPSRNEIVTEFVAWSAAHPEYMSEPAVEALFRYLAEKAPCAKGGAK